MLKDSSCPWYRSSLVTEGSSCVWMVIKVSASVNVVSGVSQGNVL